MAWVESEDSQQRGGGGRQRLGGAEEMEQKSQLSPERCLCLVCVVCVHLCMTVSYELDVVCRVCILLYCESEFNLLTSVLQQRAVNLISFVP